ncbi:LysR family transcriptional regulator [Acidaminococcus timonensis]|jgi:LysR family transcriptional regulator, transcriptional activator of the cysJI operon|uniref:LysR family transcriptional regulator n=1 Tax=Acidaminococcus TaxID=904 RepID=UPI003A5C1797
MDIDKIRAFLALVQYRNFSEAAAALYISQPAFSKQIRGLEDALQVQLFARSHKETRLTAYGKAFAPYARTLLSTWQNAREQLRQIDDLEQGTLNFGATNFIGVYLLPQQLARFHKMYPGIVLNMDINGSRTLLTRLHSYQEEFLLLSNYVELEEGKYERIPWLQDELKVIVGQGNPLFQEDSISLETLNQQLWITKNATSSLYHFLRDKLTSEGLELQHPLFISNQEGIKQAVIHNLGVAILSPRAVELELQGGLVKALPIQGYPLKREIQIVYEKGASLTPAAKAFIKLLKEKV